MKVLSIEQMTKLKELGVDVTPKEECLMYSSVGSDDYKLMYGQSVCEDDMKAFTLQDITELLPAEVETDRHFYSLNFSKNIALYNSSVYYNCYYLAETQDESISLVNFYHEEIIEVAYQMLIWVLENNYLKTK